MRVRWVRKPESDRRPRAVRLEPEGRGRRQPASGGVLPPIEDPEFLIWSALTDEGCRSTDADRAILAWLTILPVTITPPEAAMRLLRRYVPRMTCLGPGTERLLELLALISRYGRKSRPQGGVSHDPEE